MKGINAQSTYILREREGDEHYVDMISGTVPVSCAAAVRIDFEEGGKHPGVSESRNFVFVSGRAEGL